jgi:hypothetical protein
MIYKGFSFQKLFDLLNLRLAAAVVLAVVSTYLCHRYSIVADYPLSFISIAIVFPIVFSINAAFGRKEVALRAFADFKGHCVALYFASQEWGAGAREAKADKHMHTTLQKLIDSLRALLHEEDTDEAAVYRAFGALSGSVQNLRAFVASGEMSRLNQYVSKMLISFEQIENVRNYRTSVYLTAYGKTLTFLFPIIYAPYFGHHVGEFDPWWLGYTLPVMYTIVLMALQNIHDLLEDPLDGIGMDDLQITNPRWEALVRKPEVREEIVL